MSTDPSHPTPAPRRRGRPPKGDSLPAATRQLIVRAGVALLTERGISATGLDAILRQAGVPKGSFYHYFGSKDGFVAEVIAAYGSYMANRLDRHLDNPALPPLQRLWAYTDTAMAGMRRHDYQRGCLLGNLGQETAVLDETLRQALEGLFLDWEQRLTRCLDQAVADGALSADADTASLARVFWMGWEGAVLRARLRRDAEVLALYTRHFLAGLPRPPDTPPLEW